MKTDTIIRRLLLFAYILAIPVLMRLGTYEAAFFELQNKFFFPLATALIILALIKLAPSIFSKELNKTLGLKLAAISFCWVFVVQFFVNYDIYRIIIVGVYCGFFAAGTLFNEKQCRVLLIVFSAAFCISYLILAIQGIYAVLSGHEVLALPYRTQIITLGVEYQKNGPLCYLKYFDIHRNLSATLFVASLGLLAVQWFSCKNKLLRTALILAAASFYIAIALQHSRSNYLAAAVCLALWCAIGSKSYFDRWKASGKVLFSLCIAAAVCLFYAGFGFTSDIISENAPNFEYIYSSVQSEQTTNAEDTAKDTEALPTSISDYRVLSEDCLTLTYRTQIWRALIFAIRVDPSILLFGTTQEHGMALVNEYTSFWVPHMHNALLEQLLLSGLMSFLLYAALGVLILVRVFTDLFGNAEKPLYEKSFMCILCAIMTYGIFEPLDNSNKTILCAFFLSAGLYLCWEYKPLRKRKELTAAVPYGEAEDINDRV